MGTITTTVNKLAATPQQLAPVVPDAPFDLDVKLCTATYTVSSSSVDNDGDILIPSGSLPHMSRYVANPVVLWNHNRDCIPIAQSINPLNKQLSWEVGDTRIKATAHFHLLTQESAQCWALVENGILRGASVGFDAIPGKMERIPGGGMKFLEWIPLEWSVCPIPNNPETLLEAVNRQWDGKSLSPTIVKSLMAYVPKTTRTIVSMVQPRQYVKANMPWVQSKQKLAIATKGKTMAEDTQAQPGEEVVDDVATDDTPAHPPGAQAIMGFTADVESALANLNTALSSVENPDVLSLFEGVGSTIAEQVQALKDGLASIYPDIDVESETPEKAEGDKDPDGGSSGDDDNETKTVGKSLKKSAGGDHTPHIQAIQDAGEVVKEMSDSPNIPKSYRMACKTAHGGLAAACDYISKSFASKAEEEEPKDGKPDNKDGDKPEEAKAEDDESDEKPAPEEKADDDEMDEESLKALKSMQADLAQVRKEITRVTGKVQ